MRRTQFKFPVSTLVGSNLNNIFTLLKGYRIEPKYRLKLLLTIVVAGIFEIFILMEKIVWGKRIKKHQLQHPPVFIIGFWRSGTTLLHNLLCQDKEAAYTTTFQTVFPNLFLTQSGWLKPLINYFLPADRPFDNVSMDVDFPQEEEFGMMNMQPYTIYKFFIYPADFDRIIDEELFTAKLPEEHVAKWKQRYSQMIAKAVFNTGGSRYIGKNPCNLTRISLLKKMYPDAKFIFIHRNPYQVIESLYRFIQSIFPGTQLQDVPADFSREKVVLLYEIMMKSYFEERKILSPDDLIEIKLSDFLEDKTGHLRNIYETFGLGDFEKARPEIENYLASNPYSRNESYQPNQETIDLVNKYAAEIIKELDYSD